MKKIVVLAVLVCGAGVALSVPKSREFIKKHFDEFVQNYQEHEEKLYDVFAPTDEEISQAKARGKHA